MDVHAQVSKPFPEPPPFIGGLFFPLANPMEREIQEYVWTALKIYREAVEVSGKPWPGWELLERELASEFVSLLILLRAMPREAPRHQLLDLFLKGLNFENRRGRARKAREKMAHYAHGERMSELWHRELEEAWNMKASLERSGGNSSSRLRRKFPDDVVQVILARKATPESSLAKLYARRHNLSEKAARNALRKFMRASGKKFGPQI